MMALEQTGSILILTEKSFGTFWFLRNLIPILSVVVVFVEFSCGWRIVLQAISFPLGFIVLSVWEVCLVLDNLCELD